MALIISSSNSYYYGILEVKTHKHRKYNIQLCSLK
jgi:hypothetical protein